jgi:aspartate-semialdehyde dehydrogenase
MKKYNVAVVGSTGNVGRAMLEILHEREFPVENVYSVASSDSIGAKVSFGDGVLITHGLESFDFKEHKVDIALGATNAKIAYNYVPRAVQEGAIVIDNSSGYRMDPDVPLIVPEVNSIEMSRHKKKGIIANPNCCALPLSVALKPLDNAAKIKRIVVSTYQSTSGAGKSAMDELYTNTKNKFVHKENFPQNFSKEIAFNIIPQIGAFEENGYTGEENKIIAETKKIMGEHIEVTVTSVRVPVFVGHALSVNVEFEVPLSAQEAEEILSEQDGVTIISLDSDLLFMTPIEVVGEDEVFISRIRQDHSAKNALNMWIVSDNLRKGAALNAVQIAEEWIKSH